MFLPNISRESDCDKTYPLSIASLMISFGLERGESQNKFSDSESLAPFESRNSAISKLEFLIAFSIGVENFPRLEFDGIIVSLALTKCLFITSMLSGKVLQINSQKNIESTSKNLNA